MASLASIEHIVVLLFENRSFDHILGYLPHPGRLTGRESCPVDPLNPRLGLVRVNRRAPYAAGPDPHHDLISVNLQLFGNGPLTADPAPLNGFVKSYTAAAGGDVGVGRTLMQCFDPRRLPALSALAREYCLCVRWFSSVPGPTWPNRFFFHAATSDGVATNDVLHPFDMVTIYDSLEARGLTWNIYYHDFPHSIALRGLWNRRGSFRKYADFTGDARRGVLPNYSFNQVSSSPPFDFTRLGLRVPAVVASPWIERGSVDSTLFEHASVPATISKVFGLSRFLTARDRAANTLESLLTRATSRTDAPGELPTAKRPAKRAEPRGLEATPAAPLSEFQESLVQLADILGHAPDELAAVPRTSVSDEQQGALHVQEQINRFLQ